MILGLPDELIEKGKDIKSVSEIEQNGEHFTVKVTTGSKVLLNSFTAGQESEIETVTGEKVKVCLRAGKVLGGGGRMFCLWSITCIMSCALMSDAVYLRDGFLRWKLKQHLLAKPASVHGNSLAIEY